MSEREDSQPKPGVSSATQRPGPSQSQRRTPQKLGPRKHSHQTQPGQPGANTSSAYDAQNSEQDFPPSKPPTGTAGGFQSNGTGQQHHNISEQSSQGSPSQSRRRKPRRNGRGRSTTQTSESDTGSVSEVAQGGRRNRNRKKPDPSHQTGTKDTEDAPKTGTTPLDTLDEAGETADGAVDTAENMNGDTKARKGRKKKGKGKGEDGKEEKESTLRLRIDLDLDLELELKAKIQGSVTLALLD